MTATVKLVASGIETSRLGFGTSRLHYVRADERHRLLSGALDLGIVHFDVAPAYGDGVAESAVGRALQNRRDRAVIATKYGVPPNPMMAALPEIAPLWRVGRAVLRRARLYIERALPPLTAVDLKKSVEASLRRLRTDYIDILMLHEPSVARLGDAATLCEELERLRSQGVVRAYGVAGAWSDLDAILRAPAGVSAKALGSVVQTEESAWCVESPPDITFGAISQGPQSHGQRATDRTVAVERLTIALKRRPNGVVLASTTKLEHLRLLKDAADCACA